MVHKLGTLLVAATLLLAPGVAHAAGDVPPDRQPIDLPPPPKGGTDQGGGLTLPPPSSTEGGDDGDGGQSAWSTPSPAELARARHAAAMEGAFGAAGAFTGLAVTTLGVGLGQQDPGMKRGWEIASAVFGGLALVALVTGTVLWLTPPRSPVSAALLPAAGGLQLALRF
jgi:hypothetical protein